MATTQSRQNSPLSALDRVVVVEDDPVLALDIENILLEHGVKEVVLCASTEHALEALRNGRPDAIVLDVHLADRDDGWAVAELVEGFAPPAPRIVFSTGAPEDIPHDIAELGAVLAKPYEPQALVAALGEPQRRGLFARFLR